MIGQGYGNEIAEVGRCLRAGLRESPLVPHEQTLTLLRQMDDLRAQVGVELPRGLSCHVTHRTSGASRRMSPCPHHSGRRTLAQSIPCVRRPPLATARGGVEAGPSYQGPARQIAGSRDEARPASRRCRRRITGRRDGHAAAEQRRRVRGRARPPRLGACRRHRQHLRRRYATRAPGDTPRSPPTAAGSTSTTSTTRRGGLHAVRRGPPALGRRAAASRSRCSGTEP